MKLITALNNQEVQDHFKVNYTDITILAEDVGYQEGLIELLKATLPDVVLLSLDIEGGMNVQELVEAIRSVSEMVRLVIIARSGIVDHKLKNWLASQAVYDVFEDGKCTFDDIYAALTKEQQVVVKVHTKYIEREKIVQVVKEVPVEKRIVFKKQMLTVWDNAQFGCELAYVAARLSGHTVLLADLDLLAPKVDLFLNTPRYVPGLHVERTEPTSLNAAMGFIQCNTLNFDNLKKCCIQRPEAANLYIFTGSYKLSEYEYYAEEHFEKLLTAFYRYFDIVILLVNKSIYDMCTAMALIRSDAVLIPVKPCTDRLREFNNYLVFMHEKQHIPLERFKFVAFEYKESVSMDRRFMEEATQGQLVGMIRYRQKRELYRSLKVPYIKRHREAWSEYEEVLGHFGILPKSRWYSRWRSKLRGLRIKLYKMIPRKKVVKGAAD